MSRKSPAIVNIIRTVWVTSIYNPAATESGLECACVNNDDFTVLVCRSCRCHWVSGCPVWSSHSKWLSEYSNKSASNFALSLNIPLWKLFRWFSRPQLCQLVIGSFIMTMGPLMYHVKCRVFWWNTKSPRWPSPTIAQIWCPVTFGFSQN